MGLDLEIHRGPGRRPAAQQVEIVRELREADLALLSIPGESKPPELRRVTERHHALARALALGMSEGEAAATVGYQIARVSILKRSPAFQELVEFYRSHVDTEFAEIASRLAGVTKEAITILEDRLEDEPDKVSTGQLLSIITMGADRSGHGPTSKQEVNVNVGLSERLEAARLRARQAAIGQVVDAEVVREE